MPRLTEQDYELLSAYLDGQLSNRDRAALEIRLGSDGDLRRELDALRATVSLIRALPPLKAPRDFALTPAMLRPAPSRWLVFPTTTAFSALSAAAAMLLILVGAFMLLQMAYRPLPAAPEVALQSAAQTTERASAAGDQALTATAPAAASTILPTATPPLLGEETMLGLAQAGEAAEETPAAADAAAPLPQATPAPGIAAFAAAPEAESSPPAELAAPAAEADVEESSAPPADIALEAAAGAVSDGAARQATTETPTLTPSPTATASSTRPPTPTPIAELAQTTRAGDWLPLALLLLGGALLVIALATTLARRRGRS